MEPLGLEKATLLIIDDAVVSQDTSAEGARMENPMGRLWAELSGGFETMPTPGLDHQ